MRRRYKSLFVVLALGVSVFLITRFVITPFIVVGQSMEPTLRSWDFCLMTRPHPYRPVRGDIVMFRTADDPPLYFVKRVMALPGETLAVGDGVVKINGRPLSEPYTTTPADLFIEPVTVTAGNVFVMGDHREGSLHTLVATRLVQARLVWHWRWKR